MIRRETPWLTITASISAGTITHWLVISKSRITQVNGMRTTAPSPAAIPAMTSMAVSPPEIGYASPAAALTAAPAIAPMKSVGAKMPPQLPAPNAPAVATSLPASSNAAVPSVSWPAMAAVMSP